MSVLHLAAKLDQLEIVKFVIDNVEDKNPIVPTTKGFTILHMLAYDQGHVEVVDFILKQLEKESEIHMMEMEIHQHILLPYMITVT